MRSLLKLMTLLLFAALAGCGGGEGTTESLSTLSASRAGKSPQAGAVGAVRVALSGSGGCGFEHVWVTVEAIRLYRGAATTGPDASATELTFSPPRRVDLVGLAGGLLAELGTAPLATGRYEALRLVLAENGPEGAPDALANAVQVNGAGPTPLATPAAARSGIKVALDLDVAAGQTADVVLGFDPCTSVVRAGNSGRHILRPVLTAHATPGNAVTGERTVNTSIGLNLFSSSAALPDGGHAVAWYFNAGGSATGVIRVQRFAANGAPLAGELTVPGAAGQARPGIAAAADGFVVAWIDPTYQSIQWQRYDAAGLPVGTSTKVNATGGLHFWHGPVTIAALEMGGFVVSWIAADGTVYVQRFDAAGVASGAATRVNETASTAAKYTTVAAALVDGSFVVSWSHPADLGGAPAGIYARRFDANGGAIGADLHLAATDAAKDSWVNAVAGLASGGFVAVWTTGAEPLDDFDVQAQRFDAAGVPVGATIRVNTAAAGWQSEADVAAFSGGGYVVVWQTVQPATDWDVAGLRFDPAGAAIGGETLVNTTKAGNQQDPDVTVLVDGSYVVTWTSLPDASGATSIVMQRFSPTGERR